MVLEGHLAQHPARMAQHLAVGEAESSLAEHAGRWDRRCAFAVIAEVDAAAIVGAVVGRTQAVADHRCARNRVT